MRVAVGRCPDRVGNGQKPSQQAPSEHKKLAEKLAARVRRSARERTALARVARRHPGHPGGPSTAARRTCLGSPDTTLAAVVGCGNHAGVGVCPTGHCPEPGTPTSARRSLTTRSKDRASGAVDARCVRPALTVHAQVPLRSHGEARPDRAGAPAPTTLPPDAGPGRPGRRPARGRPSGSCGPCRTTGPRPRSAAGRSARGVRPARPPSPRAPARRPAAGRCQSGTAMPPPTKKRWPKAEWLSTPNAVSIRPLGNRMPLPPRAASSHSSPAAPGRKPR